MEKLEFVDDSGEKLDLFVVEQTKIGGINYLLAAESDEEGESEAYILKDMSDPNSKDANYQFVDDDSEFDAVSKVFSEIMEDEIELI